MDLQQYITIYDIDIPESFLENLLKRNITFTQTVVGNSHDRKIERTKRNCTEYILDNDIDESNIVWRAIDIILKKYIDNSNINGFQITQNLDGYSLLKYEVGDFYKEHIDMETSKVRTLSIIMVLNDGFEGGDVSFFNDTYRVPLKRNQALIFPSNFMFPHQVNQITNGTRYSIVSWVS